MWSNSISLFPGYWMSCLTQISMQQLLPHSCFPVGCDRTEFGSVVSLSFLRSFFLSVIMSFIASESPLTSSETWAPASCHQTLMWALADVWCQSVHLVCAQQCEGLSGAQTHWLELLHMMESHSREFLPCSSLSSRFCIVIPHTNPSLPPFHAETLNFSLGLCVQPSGLSQLHHNSHYLSVSFSMTQNDQPSLPDTLIPFLLLLCQAFLRSCGSFCCLRWLMLPLTFFSNVLSAFHATISSLGL